MTDAFAIGAREPPSDATAARSRTSAPTSCSASRHLRIHEANAAVAIAIARPGESPGALPDRCRRNGTFSVLWASSGAEGDGPVRPA
jgi:hypothetical protein